MNFVEYCILYPYQSLLIYMYIKWSFGKESKIEKVPRDIRGEKVRKSLQIWGKWSQLLEHMIAQKRKEPSVRKGKLSLLACNTRHTCSMETPRKSVKG